MVSKRLLESIKKHEGLELKPYECTENKLTIGYGRNLEDRGITKAEAEYLLLNDIEAVEKDLEKMFAVHYGTHLLEFPVNVLEVMIEMCFQIGVNGFFKFKKTISHILNKRYTHASIEMLDSKWARQTPNRAKTLSNKIKGKY